jgi:hypothetical protein
LRRWRYAAAAQLMLLIETHEKEETEKEDKEEKGRKEEERNRP